MSVTDAFTAAGITEPLVRYEWGGTRLITAKDDKPAQNLVFWIGRIHNRSDSNIQNVWGADYSNSGAAFNYVRYWAARGRFLLTVRRGQQLPAKAQLAHTTPASNSSRHTS